MGIKPETVGEASKLRLLPAGQLQPQKVNESHVPPAYAHVQSHGTWRRGTWTESG